MLIESAIGAIVEIVLTAAWDRGKRREAVVRVLASLNLETDNPPDDFEGLYAYALVEYGVFKPEPVLNFFRNEFVCEAFRKAFYENDLSILEDEADGIIQWNEETGRLGTIDYDPRREFDAFRRVFNRLVDYSRTPAEARRDHTLEEIRADIARLADTQQHQYSPTMSWSDLLVKCDRQVACRVKAVGQKYVRDLYVRRQEVEARFARFLESDRSCFVVLGRSGKGKTNLLCHLAESYSGSLPVLLLSGRTRIQDEFGLIEQVARELPYASRVETPRRVRMEDFLDVLRANDTVAVVLVDGISENEDVPLMKRALSELLTRYGNSRWLKFGLNCRDTLWHRFSHTVPSDLIYHHTSIEGGSRQTPVSASLGSWTDKEFRTAVRKYKHHFEVEFSLAGDAVRRCKYPLILRLLCEAYSGETLGVIDYLPTNKVFRDYLDRKTLKITEYFGLDIDPRDMFRCLVAIRAAAWEDQRSGHIGRRHVLDILCDLGRAMAVYTRLVDEGILFESNGGSLTEPIVRFLFDEVGDYLLYRHLMEQLTEDDQVTLALVNRLCSLVHSEALEEATRSERLLELIARNLEDIGLQEYLLQQVLEEDLHLFASCVEQKLVVPSLPEELQDKAIEFAARLVGWYERITARFFPNLTDSLDPFCWRHSGGESLGIDLFASPEFREVSYYYTGRDETEQRISAVMTKEYPTLQTSLVHETLGELKLHDPDAGTLLATIRAPAEVRRILNFEHDSPFPGVSLDAPERVAKYDIWQELVHIIDDHWLKEPLTLVHDRTVSLINELEGHGINVQTTKALEESRERILSRVPENSREHLDISTKLDVLHHNLAVLGDRCDLSWLPRPDLDEDSRRNEQARWWRYSDDQMRDYLYILFPAFAACYRVLVEKNLANISHRMNLYRQWPVSMFVLVSPRREQTRVFAVPESDEEEARLNVNLLPVDSSPDIADGEIMANGVLLQDYVHDTLCSTGRMTTSSHLIDTLVDTEHLFTENPLNYLTYNWLKSELAEVIHIPFQFGG